ncbi:MAG: ACT domain-containing protein [Pseudomonadales bacterium]
MTGITDLNELLASMSPDMQDGEFVFCTVPEDTTAYNALTPVATFREREGLTLVLPVVEADSVGLAYDGTYRQITLEVHSSLSAVGLTAAFASKLTEYGISANVIAGYYHDHIFVQTDKAERALAALDELSQQARSG